MNEIVLERIADPTLIELAVAAAALGVFITLFAGILIFLFSCINDTMDLMFAAGNAARHSDYKSKSDESIGASDSFD